MTALIWIFLKDNWAPITIVVAVFALLGGVYVKGHSDGTAEGKAAQMQATYEQLKQRGVTNEAVKNMSDDARCRAIGGVFADGQCN